ncbi:MAG: GYF domain-containing protein [Opitutales bacterium]|nr:GYF domain-containing protein [Opitutales bacterium]
MISIEKNNQSSLGFFLRLGDHQSHEVSEQDLKNLYHCLTQTIDKGVEEAPDHRVRLLNDRQFEEGRYNDGRSVLWIEEKKWHLNPKEERHILQILKGLIGMYTEDSSLPSIWIHRDGKNEGPFTLDQLRQMNERKEIIPSTPTCVEGANSWGKLEDWI